MKKLSLDLTRLEVESFHADAAPDGRGTVRGHISVVGVTCGPDGGPSMCDPYSGTPDIC